VCNHPQGHDHHPADVRLQDHAPPPEPAPAPAQGNNGGSHDHGHEHGWSPWRYAVLLLPVILYLLDLPGPGFSQDYLKSRLPRLDNLDLRAPENTSPAATVVGLFAVPGDGPWLALAGLTVTAHEEEKPYFIEFAELNKAAYVPQLRAELHGKTRLLLGQFVTGNTDNTCSLVRIKMQCCAADAQPLNVVIIAPDKLTDVKPLSWVEVEGQVQFRKRRDKNEYLPVLQIKSRDKIKPADPPKNPYL
jgi:hypothetical protein